MNTELRSLVHNVGGKYYLYYDGCVRWTVQNIESKSLRTRIINFVYNTGFINYEGAPEPPIPATEFVDKSESWFLRHRNVGRKVYNALLVFQKAVADDIRRIGSEMLLRATGDIMTMESASDSPIRTYQQFVRFVMLDNTAKALKELIISMYRSITSLDPSEEYVQTTILMLWLNMHRQSQSIPL